MSKVKGYYRSNGTYVKSYTRSAPKTVSVSNYVKNDGTKVSGYKRSKPSYTTVSKKKDDEIYYLLSNMSLLNIREKTNDVNENEITNKEEEPFIVVDENGNELFDIDTELICPISNDIIKYPVSTKCGHNFDKYFILQWLEKKENCPICREKIKNDDLSVNEDIEEKLQKLCFKRKDILKFSEYRKL
jgi:hypothetical protein